MALLGPPLIITREQIDELVGILHEALTQVETELDG
jgi:adenosylmethionine-8-amino-7-oxononanoate aminotransferase